METIGTLRILGTITHIGDAQSRGNWASVYYPMMFKGEGNEFYGEMRTSKEYMEKRGIKVGAIGHMDIAFNVYQYERNGDTNAIQRVTFKQFTLANAGVFTDNVPAANEAPKITEKTQEAAPAAPAAVAANIDPTTGLPF